MAGDYRSAYLARKKESELKLPNIPKPNDPTHEIVEDPTELKRQFETRGLKASRL
jgi:hypothetical protein